MKKNMIVICSIILAVCIGLGIAYAPLLVLPGLLVFFAGFSVSAAGFSDSVSALVVSSLRGLPRLFF